MKRKHYILGTLALLCLLGTGYYVWTLYDAHRKQVVEWNEGAKAAFEEALWMEVDKRAEIPVYSYFSGEQGMTTLKEKIPDSVSVMAIEGWKKFKIDRNKYNHSMIKETRKRASSSSLFNKYPLSVDSLTIHWDSLLCFKHIPTKSRIRYIYTDLALKNDTVYSTDNYFLPFDSLTVNYLGFRCEHELVGYISYPSLVSGLSGGTWFWLLFPWIVLGLSGILYAPMEAFFRRKFVEEKIVEKEIHVADVAIDKAKVFQLPDGCLFDSFTGILTKGKISKQLPPQSALLLKLFLRKENHRLSPTEIEQELWPMGGTTNQLHKVIQRLRGGLKNVSSEVVIKNRNGTYELKTSISSKILDKIRIDED